MEKFEYLERKAAASDPLTRSEADALSQWNDLVRIGVLGETARRALSGDRVTYGRVAVAAGGELAIGEAGEVRLEQLSGSVDDIRARVRSATALARDVPVTAFSVSSLLALAGNDLGALERLARDLRDDGLTAVADVPVDAFSGTETLVAAVRAVVNGGLGAWRATIGRASLGERLDLIDRVLDLQHATSVVRAFAPLPRIDASDAPSTGYDDVRTVAIARLRLTSVPAIQVDWPLYGPKLAQVAIAFGANDVDGIAAMDDGALGPRRAPTADIERQIRAAAGVPVERDGRYEPRS